MTKRINNIQSIAENRLCCGCGVCAYISPDTVQMVDDINEGRRPIITSETRASESHLKAVQACPGISLQYEYDRDDPELIQELVDEWGPVRTVLEGYATSEALRYAGSSGGVATALALFCLEQDGMNGALHITARSDIPYLNCTVLSTTKQEVMSAVGSRYAPASPCEGLQRVVDAPSPCVIIGKPCDIAAVQRARKFMPELDAKIGLSVSIFCAATSPAAGTLAVMDHLGVTDRNFVCGIRYRGNGWPGNFAVSFDTGGDNVTREMTYADSWDNILCHFRQWRCNLCADHTGEFADISVGDPWYRDISPDDPGRSLVLGRTERGQSILRRAVDKKYLILESSDPKILPASQPSLLKIRRTVWGRLFTLRLLGIPVPEICGIPLFRLWLTKLSLNEKTRSIFGTLIRVFRYRLRKPQRVCPFKENSDKQRLI